MNYLKPSVTGVDIPIQNLQKLLYAQILDAWSLDDTTFNLFGRVYKNQAADGYLPEVYKGNNEYNDAYFDDTISASAFFGLGENTQISKSDWSADVYLVFMVDLSKIKPGNNRNDEEARVDVEKICFEKNFGFTLSGIALGLPSVFKEFNIKGIKFRDTHPLHCFRLNFKLLYNIYDC